MDQTNSNQYLPEKSDFFLILQRYSEMSLKNLDVWKIFPEYNLNRGML